MTRWPFLTRTTSVGCSRRPLSESGRFRLDVFPEHNESCVLIRCGAAPCLRRRFGRSRARPLNLREPGSTPTRAIALFASRTSRAAPVSSSIRMRTPPMARRWCTPVSRARFEGRFNRPRTLPERISDPFERVRRGFHHTRTCGHISLLVPEARYDPRNNSKQKHIAQRGRDNQDRQETNPEIPMPKRFLKDRRQRQTSVR